jgi:hypothetical protein
MNTIFKLGLLSICCFLFGGSCKDAAPQTASQSSEKAKVDTAVPPKTQSSDLYVLTKRIHQLETFMKRFNGEEIESFGKPQDHSVSDKINNLQSLFDEQYLKTAQEVGVKTFVSQVLTQKPRLLLNQPDWFVSVQCRSLLKSDTVDLTLALKYEFHPADSTSQWVLVGMNSDFIQMPLYSKDLAYLPPNAHELDFMRLKDALKTPVDLAFKGYKVDKLSIFLFLLARGDLKIDQIKDIKYHFLQIPNWTFEVAEITNDTHKSGWLITNLLSQTNSAKNEYLMKDLGISNDLFYLK